MSQLSFADFRVLGEAIALAIPVEVGLRCLTLDTLVARLGETRGAGRRLVWVDIERAARLVDVAALFYPLNATCLKKSLVLLRILRKRGVPAELRVGVRMVHGNFTSHAWIECDGQTFLGGGVEQLYSTLPVLSRGRG